MLSFEEIFSSICGKLGDTKIISNKFSELHNDENRFKFTFDICTKFIHNLNFQRTNKTAQKFYRLSEVGNSNFSKNLFWEAIRSYNEAIAFAPFESQYLALGFYHRSLALGSLSFLKEADSDCSSALELVRDDNLKINVEKHKENICKADGSCKSTCLIGNGVIQPLNNGKSSFFDSASQLVKFLYDKQSGRHLRADDDIKTGDVLIVEKSYSSVLLPNHLYTHCSNCFKRSLNLKPCKECSFAMFCSEECQRESWKNNHEIECKILDILVSLKFERMELLSLRILINASAQGKNLQKLHNEITKFSNVKQTSYNSSDFMNIYNLITNTEKRTASDLFYRCVISVVLIYLLEKFTDFFSCVEDKELYKMFCGGLILHFMQNLPCNAHEVSEFGEDGLHEIGAAVYATLSLINHSCDPNVVRYSCGDSVVLRAIKPIKKGEEILDNYGYHYAIHSLSERQTALMKQYYFKCECEACVKLWPTYEHLPSENVQLKKEISKNVYQNRTDKFEENLFKIFSGEFSSDVIEENMKYLDFLDEFVVRPWQNYNKCQEAIKHCLCFSGNHFRFSKGVSC